MIKTPRPQLLWPGRHHVSTELIAKRALSTVCFVNLATCAICAAWNWSIRIFCCPLKQAVTLIFQSNNFTLPYRIKNINYSFTSKAHMVRVSLFVCQVAIFWLVCTTSFCLLSDFCMQSVAVSMLRTGIIVPQKDFDPWSTIVHGNKSGKISSLNYSQGQMKLQC